MLNSSRLPWIDALRGLALIAMVIYHTSWNIEVFQFATLGVFSDPIWIWTARLIAGAFLCLAGISLCLAAENKVPVAKMFRRVGKIAAGAFLVSTVTFVVFGENYVYFGILHHIALASLLCIPLLRTTYWIILALLVLVLSVHATIEVPSFDSRAIAWLGLVDIPPATNDFVPLFPWIAVVFAGMLFGRVITAQHRWHSWLAQVPTWTNPLVWMGRRSLIIYLVHQPVLFGVAWVIFQLKLGPPILG